MAVNPTTTSKKPAPGRRRSVPVADANGRAEATRQAILDAALEVFCEQTYGSARIEQIAERAGVAVGSIYKHFASKQALANELFRHWKVKTLDYTFPHSRSISARDSFHGWFEQFCRFANDYPLAHEFLQTHHHASYLDEESRRLGDPMDKLATDVFRRGQKQGLIRDGDAGLLCAMVLGVYLGLTRELKARGKKLDAKTLALGEQCAWDMISKK
jgi:AcrR family transcriptional regulator